ncbi:unnamed protein product [Lactuca saligna]|uniref:Protein kinase domain-containing protein n=1 Tax=Lactuca saligna TaxID=75948 RepID=A0AA35ZJG2_LACSI|nr:unnamed protein product [Lactuca saligna]
MFLNHSRRGHNITTLTDFDPPVYGKKIAVSLIVAIVGGGVFFVFLIVLILWRKGFFTGKNAKDRELKGLDLQTGIFTLRQIKAATKNFDLSNKLGEGGFGVVSKGSLSDGSIIAVKQLSSKSKQGGTITAYLVPFSKLQLLTRANSVCASCLSLGGNDNARAFSSKRYPSKLDTPHSTPKIGPRATNVECKC